jgi:hypothetical protein
VFECAAVEAALYSATQEFNLAGFFDLSVFAKPGVAPAPIADEALRQRAREVLRPRRSLRQHG